MKEQLEKIYSNAMADIENSATVKDLEDVKFKYLSRKGEFNEIKKGLKDLSPEDKRIVGSRANEITKCLESAISKKFTVFYLFCNRKICFYVCCGNYYAAFLQNKNPVVAVSCKIND